MKVNINLEKFYKAHDINIVKIQFKTSAQKKLALQDFICCQFSTQLFSFYHRINQPLKNELIPQ